MNSNTTFFRLIDEFVIQSKTKLWIFQSIVTVSIFALFLGFVCGNLFGTFLNYFRNFVSWDGFIISLTILVIEFISYLNFRYPKDYSIRFPNFFSFFFKRQPNRIKKSLDSKKLLSVQSLPFAFTKAKADKAFRQMLPRFFDSLLLLQKQGRANLMVPPSSSDNYSSLAFTKAKGIKILNFYKIGLLLGFFIDAFKVGS